MYIYVFFLLQELDDPLILETIACREALALAEDLNLQNVLITSDCKQAIRDINNASMGKNGSIVREIITRSSDFLCKFSYEGRAANKEAHSLVSFAIGRGPGRHTWLGQPHNPSCIPLLVEFDE